MTDSDPRNPLVAYEDDFENDTVHHPYTAWNQGFDASEQGIPISLNPYKDDSREFDAWNEGWSFAAIQYTIQ